MTTVEQINAINKLSGSTSYQSNIYSIILEANPVENKSILFKLGYSLYKSNLNRIIRSQTSQNYRNAIQNMFDDIISDLTTEEKKNFRNLSIDIRRYSKK